MVRANAKSKPTQNILLFMVLLFAGLFVLKVMNVWVGVSTADASVLFGGKATARTFGAASLVNEGERQEQIQSQEPQTVQPTQTVLALPDVSSEGRILERLGARHQALIEREKALEVRESVLAAAEVKLEEQLAAFRAERNALETLEARREAARSEELLALVNAYERMKPRDAARIFEILDDELLISVAGDMRTQSLSGVLAEMEPERARELTKLMAERYETVSEKTEIKE